MAARAWIRLGAVWVNTNSRAFDTARQCFSLLAMSQGKCRLLSRGLMPLQKYEREIARGKAPAGLENNQA